MITDAQVHIWEVDRPGRPWPPARNEPQLPDGFSAEQAIARMDEAGVDRAVIVPPTWIGEQNDTATEACEAYPGRFAIMGRFNPQAPGAEGVLETWLQQPHMLGIRMTFRIEPFSAWLDDGSIDWFWGACERLGVPLMVLVPGVVPKLAPIAGRHPGLKLIIDHMGCELDRKGAAAFDHIEMLEQLASSPHVYVKVSSAPNFSSELYPFADIEPFMRRLYDAYGAQRLLWGSDLTRLASTYSECVQHFASGLSFLSASDSEWILGRSAAEVLGWPETRP